jgi:tetratricopeptide (TPR) repeat protein
MTIDAHGGSIMKARPPKRVRGVALRVATLKSGTVRTDSWDTTRQMFADQFDQSGTDYIYRKSQKGEAIRISAAERARFVEEFDRNLRRASWIIYVGLAVGLGIVLLVSMRGGPDITKPGMLAAIGLVMIPYTAYFRWVWGAPARELIGRMPVAGPRSEDEVRRLRFHQLKYGKLGAAAFGGLVIPLVGSSHGDVFSGWNRLWLALGAATILLAAVQAFRKWRFESSDPYQDLARASSRPKADLSVNGTPRGDQIWRYLPLVAILGGGFFFFFAPAGKQFAQKPSFFPILMIGLGSWALFTVARGFAKGRIQPFVRGSFSTYERETQPKRFWASMGWNAIFAGFCLWTAFVTTRDASAQDVQDSCYNQHNELSAQESFEACTELIEGRARLTYLNMADAYDYRAFADERLGNRSRALADYTQAIRFNPRDDYAYLQRGLIFLNSMRLDQATADFTRAHELDPKSPWPLADRGMAYAWKNDRARAEADFAAVRGIDRANIVVLHGEGVLAMNAGNLENAVESFTAALRQEPSDTWSIQMRADAYQQMGEFEKARQDREKLRHISQSARAVAESN